MIGRASACALAALAAAGPRVAWAQAEPRISAGASARQVEVGEPFRIELKAMAEQGSPVPSDPELRAPGFSVSGPQISTQMVMQSVNGVSSVATGIGATWQLVPERAGHFVIPAPSVAWNGKRLKAQPIAVDVVAGSGRPRAQPPSPFLLPGGPSFTLPWPAARPGRGADELDDADIGQAHDLALDAAPDQHVFLRAVADKREAVVGEQVTVSFYLYERAMYERTDRRDPPMSDFLRVPLLKNPGTDPPVLTQVGDQRFIVQLLDKVALFPVRAGDLHVGSMRMGVALRGRGGRVQRESNDLVIRVTEPPAAGRPPGYTVGDVGQFGIGATVQPRKIEQGGAVSVTLKVSGHGYVPQSLRVPARTGVEWLDPEKREAIETSGAAVGGWRSFGYVVRIKDTGIIDLGKIELPYWDPVAKRYHIASAVLGTVEVTPSYAAPTASAAADARAQQAAERAADPFASLPSPRRALGEYTPAPPPMAEGARLWLLLAAPPLLVGLVSVGGRAARAARDRRAARLVSATTLTAAALDDATIAESRGDAKALASAAERAIHHAVEGATGLKSRGVLLADLPRDLEARGMPADVVARACAALAECESVRFDPAATAKERGALLESARSVTKDLARSRPR